MSQDAFGNAITATDPATVEAITGFSYGLVSYEMDILKVLPAAEADTQPNTLLQAYTAVLWLLSESPEGPEKAQGFIARAEQGFDNANPRERLFYDFARAWVSGDLTEALRRSDALIDAFPRDLTAIKLRQYIDFNLGHFSELLRTGLIAQKAAPDIAYVHGMVAFGYEQCHLLGEAEDAARHALSLKAREPWAQHALAHVMLTEGRIDEGVEFLESVAHHWQGLNSFMYTHLWWHMALFRLSQGRGDEALEIYDDHAWNADKTYSQDQVGAVSLLARLELAGLEVGGRWEDLAGYLKVRAHDVIEPFLSLQYLYGLARAGRSEAQTLLDAIAHKAEVAVGPGQSAWHDCAWPLARGIIALLSGNPAEAIHALRRGMPYLASIGGSHAQRDLFEQILLKGLIDTGHDLEVQQILEARRAYDPYGVPLNRALAEVYNRLKLPELAERTLRRIEIRLTSLSGAA
jgi:tetratricopeptide (TPR) repeat protein